jgi:hypothetical protein
VLFLFLKWRLQANAQRLLVPSLLNEMVAVQKKSRRVVIQRRSSLKAQGAAEKGCAQVLQELIFFWILCIHNAPTCSQNGTRN